MGGVNEGGVVFKGAVFEGGSFLRGGGCEAGGQLVLYLTSTCITAAKQTLSLTAAQRRDTTLGN